MLHKWQTKSAMSGSVICVAMDGLLTQKPVFLRPDVPSAAAHSGITNGATAKREQLWGGGHDPRGNPANQGGTGGIAAKRRAEEPQHSVNAQALNHSSFDEKHSWDAACSYSVSMIPLFRRASIGGYPSLTASTRIASALLMK